MADDLHPVDFRDPEFHSRPVMLVADPDGVVHGWDRYRTAPDESEDITWCNQRPGDVWTKLESKTFIDCMACLGSDEARYHEDANAR